LNENCRLGAWMVLGMFCLAAVVPNAADSGMDSKIDAVFSQFRSDREPGMAVLVVKDGKKVFERGYGVRGIRTREKIDARTNFRLASVSKQFTAMAVMLLVHEKKLAFSDTLTDIFPGFPEYGKQITIRQMLTHTSGLLAYEDLMAKQYPGIPDEQIPQIHDAGVLDLLKQEKTTKFVPGTAWDYSNSGYCLLAMVVEKKSGKSFGQFLQERIFVPLKMDHTLAYEKGKNEVSNRAYGNTKSDAGWKETDQSSTSATLGDGGIYTSLEDMAKWDEALRNHTLLSEKEMEVALTPVTVNGKPTVEPNGKPVSYGFGWFLDSYKGHEHMWHYGETMGFRTTIQRFPKDGLTVVVLANRVDLVPAEYALRVADLYLK
jgi:CubicO group peptidase (beta-lactamase class C family)